jgi:cytoplasmic iron level regulating protein YaaA (DUF328/UPF0246 family)
MLVLVPPSEGKASGGRGRWRPESGTFGADLGARRRQVVDALDVDGPALPAWQRFTGVVWKHLDPATLPPAARQRLVVPNALLGLCRGHDPVPEFRLKFSVSLPALGRLDRWWRPALTEAIGRTRGPIVDLLPLEHAAAVDLPERRVVRVRFGGRGHDAKAVKGLVARAVLLEGVDALDGFAWQGWTASPTDEGVFVTPP